MKNCNIGIVLSAIAENIPAARSYIRKQINGFEDPFYVTDIMEQVDSFIKEHFTTQPPNTEAVELGFTLDPDFISVSMINLSTNSSKLVRLPRLPSKSLLHKVKLSYMDEAKKDPKEPEGAPGGLYPGAKKVASKSKTDKGGSPKKGGKK